MALDVTDGHALIGNGLGNVRLMTRDGKFNKIIQLMSRLSNTVCIRDSEKPDFVTEGWLLALANFR